MHREDMYMRTFKAYYDVNLRVAIRIWMRSAAFLSATVVAYLVYGTAGKAETIGFTSSMVMWFC